MSLMKVCRCNKVIDYNKKYCDECTKMMEQMNKDRYKQYQHRRLKDKELKKRQSFYNSSSWINVRDKIKRKYNGLCIVCLIKNNLVRASDLVHHIYTTEKYWDKRLDERFLITLCDGCHGHIHREMDKDITEEEKVVEELIELLEIYRDKFDVVE